MRECENIEIEFMEIKSKYFLKMIYKWGGEIGRIIWNSEIGREMNDKEEGMGCREDWN